jgi:predicted  nucleic acid-binding Zn-ribbon protein
MGDESAQQEQNEEIQRLRRRVEDLERRLADVEVMGWEGRIEQLQLEAALGRMEMRDELTPRVDRLRQAFENARQELQHVPTLVGEALEETSEGFRPALEQLKRAYEEAREAIRK